VVSGPAIGGADTAPLLEINGLTVTIGSGPNALTAVRGIDLTLQRGESLGVVGESGAGKSLSMLSVTSLLPKNARLSWARMAVNGVELIGLRNRELRKIRGAEVGMIFQDPMTSLNPVFTVGRQVGEAIKIHNPGMSRRAIDGAAIELLASVAIPSPKERISSYPFELSGGMRQRVMIAIAIANNPALLIADEPTTALTSRSRRRYSAAGAARRRTGHGPRAHHPRPGRDRQHGRPGGRHVRGRIVEERTTTDLFADPRHLTRSAPGLHPAARRDELAHRGIPGTRGPAPRLAAAPSRQGAGRHSRLQDMTRSSRGWEVNGWRASSPPRLDRRRAPARRYVTPISADGSGDRMTTSEALLRHATDVESVTGQSTTSPLLSVRNLVRSSRSGRRPVNSASESCGQWMTSPSIWHRARC
jgi:ABC-type dipeptide/oligopeptide/nickel transport system ATPase subunit